MGDSDRNFSMETKVILCLVMIHLIDARSLNGKHQESGQSRVKREDEYYDYDNEADEPTPARDVNGNAIRVPERQPFPFREDISESYKYEVIGDMVVRKDLFRAGLVDVAWPGGIVPYTFADTIDQNKRTLIMQAMNELQEISCVVFRPATREDSYNLEFKNDPMVGGCSSYVGWENRINQGVQLGPRCKKGNIIHEVLHALGFFHEQTRNDRDEYVTINFQNIQTGYENNFQRNSDLFENVDYFGVPYNYDSIMHYGVKFFSNNGQNTIDVKATPENKDVLGDPANLGQRKWISEGDKKMLREKYNCKYMK